MSIIIEDEHKMLSDCPKQMAHNKNIFHIFYHPQFLYCVNLKFDLVLFCRPTFKTATPTSRTQLKQQLQREQLQELERQEIERRENDRKLSMQVNGLNVDHSQMAHSSHLMPTSEQLQIPRGFTNIPHIYPTPSTSTDGSDFNSGQFSGQTNPMPNHSDLPSAPLKVPLHIGVDLPPQVLKVCHI